MSLSVNFIAALVLAVTVATGRVGVLLWEVILIVLCVCGLNWWAVAAAMSTYDSRLHDELYSLH